MGSARRRDDRGYVVFHLVHDEASNPVSQVVEEVSRRVGFCISGYHNLVQVMSSANSAPYRSAEVIERGLQIPTR